MMYPSSGIEPCWTPKYHVPTVSAVAPDEIVGTWNSSVTARISMHASLIDGPTIARQPISRSWCHAAKTSMMRPTGAPWTPRLSRPSGPTGAAG